MHERDGDLLPSDVLVEILSRLPGKTLMRFKCVLKCWFSLITDPVFAELHNTRSYKREGGGIFVTPTSSTDNCLMCIIDMKKEPLDRISVLEPYIPYDNNRTSNIVNGLICFDHDTYDKHLIYLYNLTSRESISLPSTQVENHLRPLSKRFSRTCLLGVDPINKEYKVLHFHSRRENHKMKCQVFTIGDQKKVWRPLDISHIQGYNNFTYNSCNDHLCVDGFLYWTKSDMMIRFDVVREIFNLIHFPKEKWYGLQSALVKLKVVFF